MARESTAGFICLIGGAPGTGKTMQGILYQDCQCKKVYIDIENKVGTTLNSLIKQGMVSGDIDVKCPLVYDAKYHVDYVKTFQKLENIVDEVLASDYDVIVFDSATHLRNSTCANYYCAMEDKKQINQDAWRKVNKNVRDIMEPLVNYCRAAHKTLLITGHLKDEYDNNVCIGKKFDVKEFIEHYCDATIKMESTKEHDTYTAICTRSNSGGWVEDITGKVSLDMVFEEKGMI